MTEESRANQGRRDTEDQTPLGRRNIEMKNELGHTLQPNIASTVKKHTLKRNKPQNSPAVKGESS